MGGFEEERAQRDRALVDALHPRKDDEQPSEEEEPSLDHGHADLIAAVMAPGARRTADAQLVKSMHGDSFVICPGCNSSAIDPDVVSLCANCRRKADDGSA